MSSTKTEITTPELCVLDQIRGIGLEGLKYASDPYDICRYNRLIELAAVQYAEILRVDIDTLRRRFLSEIGVTTPKLGSDAAVVDTDGRILVLRRSDDDSWCLPCGWVDLGENPAQAAIRETKEEAGLTVEAVGYIAISHKGPQDAAHIQHQICTTTLMKPVLAGVAVTLSHEHTDYRWITVEEGRGLDWHIGHDKQYQAILAYLQGDGRDLLPII